MGLLVEIKIIEVNGVITIIPAVWGNIVDAPGGRSSNAILIDEEVSATRVEEFHIICQPLDVAVQVRVEESRMGTDFIICNFFLPFNSFKSENYSDMKNDALAPLDSYSAVVKSRTLLQIEDIGESENYEDMNSSNIAMNKFGHLHGHTKKSIENNSEALITEMAKEITSDSNYSSGDIINHNDNNIQQVIELNKDRVSAKWRTTCTNINKH